MNILVWTSIKLIILTLLITVTSLNSNSTANRSNSLLKSIGYSSLGTVSGIYKFGFNNYHKILSRKFLAASIIAGAPYLYFSDTNALEKLTELAVDFTFKMSVAVSSGILNSLSNNPAAIAKIIAVSTVSQTGKKIAEKAAFKLAEIILTIASLGTIR